MFFKIYFLLFMPIIFYTRRLNTITINGNIISLNDISYLNYQIFNNINSIISIKLIETNEAINKFYYYSDSSNKKFFA